MSDKIKGISNDMLSKAKDGIEEYPSNIPLQLTVFNIPGYGPIFDVLIREIGSKISSQRLSETITLIQNELNLLDLNKIDKEYLVSDDFYDLILKVLSKSIKDRFYEKKKIFAKILSNSIIQENKGLRENSEDFLNLLEDLNVRDLELLKNIFNQQKDMKQIFDQPSNTYNEVNTVHASGWDELKYVCRLDDDEFQIALLKLSRSGFIRELHGSYTGYMGGTYMITPILKKLINLIKEL